MEDVKLEVGDKVTYCGIEHEHGIVKSFNPDGQPFVVYKCNNDWENYKNYTGVLTYSQDLRLGWL